MVVQGFIPSEGADTKINLIKTLKSRLEEEFNLDEEDIDGEIAYTQLKTKLQKKRRKKQRKERSRWKVRRIMGRKITEGRRKKVMEERTVRIRKKIKNRRKREEKEKKV